MQISLQQLFAVSVAACTWWLVRKMLRPRTPETRGRARWSGVGSCKNAGRKEAPPPWLLKNRTTPITPTPTLRERYNLLH